MKGLNRFLTDYCEYWRPIGLKLGLQSAVLGLIEADHRLQQRECFRETLQKWLQQDIHATWRKLELAITNAKREYLGLDALKTSKSNGSLLFSHTLIDAQGIIVYNISSPTVCIHLYYKPCALV